MIRTVSAPALALTSFLVSALSAHAKPLIAPRDYGKWETLGNTRLAPCGDWVAVMVARVNEENELRIRGVPRDTTVAVPFGSAAALSADGKWVAYANGVSPKERDKRRAILDANKEPTTPAAPRP